MSWWRGVQWIMHSIKHINIWPLTLWSHNRDGTKNDVQVQMLLWYLYFFVIGWDFVIDMLVIKTHLIAVMCIQIINLQKHNFKWSNSSHYCFFYLLRYTKVWVHAWIQRYWSWLPLKKDLCSSSNMQKKKQKDKKLIKKKIHFKKKVTNKKNVWPAIKERAI